MTDDELLTEYKARHAAMLAPLAEKLQAHIKELLDDVARIDRVSARAKAPERFIGKAKTQTAAGARKYDHPFEQIQDLVGARVIVFYKQDVDAVSKVLNRYLRRIESKNLVPDSVDQFGYVGRHFILAIPEDVVDDDADRSKTPQFFELQVKTLFQHAWSEAEHDLAYKPSEALSPHQQRQIAFTAAQAWGADEIFEQLYSELGRLAS